jgi:hypothetical protein
MCHVRLDLALQGMVTSVTKGGTQKLPQHITIAVKVRERARSRQRSKTPVNKLEGRVDRARNKIQITNYKCLLIPYKFYNLYRTKL